jgi:hypothetical protein
MRIWDIVGQTRGTDGGVSVASTKLAKEMWDECVFSDTARDCSTPGDVCLIRFKLRMACCAEEGGRW